MLYNICTESQLIIVIILVISIRLDGESEEVEARVVGDEDGVEAVPPVVGVGHLGSHINFNTQ